MKNSKKLLNGFFIFLIILSLSLSFAGCSDSNENENESEPELKIEVTSSEDRIYESMDYIFIPDDEILGKWQYVDFIENIEDFDPANIKTPFTGLETFEFFEDGTSLMNNAVHDKWTKGYVIRQINSVVPAYTIKQIDGTNYMFFEWKDNENYFVLGNKPPYYVFQKALD